MGDNKGASWTSPFFGLTRESTEVENKLIEALIAEVPVSVFQFLNKKLNSNGYAICIALKEERNENS